MTLYPEELQLHTPRIGVAEQSLWAHEQHGNQDKAGSHSAKASANAGIQITCRQTLNQTNDHGADDRSGDAVEAAYDHDREYLRDRQAPRQCRLQQ